MKKALTMSFLILVIISCQESSKSYDISWKLNRNKSIYYRAEVDRNPSGDKAPDNNPTSADSDNKNKLQLKEWYKRIVDTYGDYTFSCKLSSINDSLLQLEMERHYGPIDSTVDILAQFKNALSPILGDNFISTTLTPSGIFERGTLNLHQSNIIALFFQLPPSPIHLGDKWSINVNFFKTNQAKPDSTYFLNKIWLADVTKKNKKDIATIKYHIVQYRGGRLHLDSIYDIKLNSPEFHIKYEYRATGHFSLDKGRWIDYEGKLNKNAQGLFPISISEEYTLSPQTSTF